jgi:hypothetical protein
MDKTKLQIASVKLTNSGMKGIEVVYLLPSIKGNVQFFDEYKSKRKTPIHAELEETFSWLKSHLLDICGYTLEAEERDYLMGVTEITGIKCGEKGIAIFGDLLVLGGTRVLKLETPLITDEVEYPEFNKLKAIADGIYAETKEYMAGKKVMSDVQIVARFNKGKDDFDADSFSKMTKAEQRELATKILEDQGCMVFHNDEITADDDAGEVVDTTKKEEPVKAPIKTEKKAVAPKAPEPSFEEEEQPEPVVEAKEDLSVAASRRAEPVVTLTEEDGDFALPLVKVAPKKSTAKLKVK